MGDGFWSPAGDGEFYGIPKAGCWYRKPGGEAFWVTGGVHVLYGAVGFEAGPLGLPISNFDNETGRQAFQRGTVFWDGEGFAWAAEGRPINAKPFDMLAPPSAPPN